MTSVNTQVWLSVFSMISAHRLKTCMSMFIKWENCRVYWDCAQCKLTPRFQLLLTKIEYTFTSLIGSKHVTIAWPESYPTGLTWPSTINRTLISWGGRFMVTFAPLITVVDVNKMWVHHSRRDNTCPVQGCKAEYESSSLAMPLYIKCCSNVWTLYICESRDAPLRKQPESLDHPAN